ncbi:putative secretory component protein shr3 [Thermoascus aurantiacus ATCC 26904]
MALRSGSFATFLIVCPTCFFLGIIFSLFPYDYPLLWSTQPTPPSHYDLLESHLRFLHASPPLIPRILHIVIFLGLAGLIAKLYRPSESNMLFDGASLVLYMCGITVYIANIVKGLRLVSGGKYGAELAAGPAASAAVHGAAAQQTVEGENGEQILGREDSLKVLAASNTILALVLVGVLVLQAGQWYAERKDAQEYESLTQGRKSAGEREKEKERESGGGATAAAPGRVTRQASASKKKQ